MNDCPVNRLVDPTEPGLSADSIFCGGLFRSEFVFVPGFYFKLRRKISFLYLIGLIVNVDSR